MMRRGMEVRLSNGQKFEVLARDYSYEGRFLKKTSYNEFIRYEVEIYFNTSSVRSSIPKVYSMGTKVT
ncbi:hypothetical protein QJS10_CPB12g00747 [Acorus calamus]|uniref:Uncharacterized protein n=1 Tax=Acorus calamus TaxID=4465 RepID=A0AAV9DL99_ACOCL|nr:hypothetical protein QJS10_CPB12g00747 [Acorus calamus]